MPRTAERTAGSTHACCPTWCGSATTGPTRAGGPRDSGAAALSGRQPLPVWRPDFRRRDLAVRLGDVPVDLGGIGKGLAVRWASQSLRGAGRGHLVDAGGDCECVGQAVEGGPWRVAVEDPRGGTDPVAVLALSDAAVATSSVRIRHWQAGGRDVHHLIDPDTGLPGGEGLLAVTVVDTNSADAEVWSKVLFLTGRRGVAATAEHLGVAALWVTDDGQVAASRPMQDRLLWTAP